jgi:carbonic anhydrase
MFTTLFQNNAAWAEERKAADPDFFNNMAKEQHPEFFWIGCSDSRVPANIVTDLDAGEIFVHRNVANVVHSSDLNLLSALEFAVEVLEVKHIVVCGHYGCGGVKAASDEQLHGLVDHWLEPIRRLAHRHMHKLVVLEGEEARLDRLAELNVIDGVARLCETPILRKAWDNHSPVAVHGVICGLKDGRLRDLGCTVASGLKMEPGEIL